MTVEWRFRSAKISDMAKSVWERGGFLRKPMVEPLLHKAGNHRASTNTGRQILLSETHKIEQERKLCKREREFVDTAFP